MQSRKKKRGIKKEREIHFGGWREGKREVGLSMFSGKFPK